MNYKILFLIIIVLTYLVNLLISLLEINSVKRPIPDLVKDVYDVSTYANWKSYKYESIRFGIIEDTVKILFLILMIIFNFYPFVSRNISNQYLEILVVLSIYIAVDFLVSLPFSIYKDFHIEAKYGFNRTTPITFLKDTLIGLLIEFVITLTPVYFYVLIYGVLNTWTILISFIALLIIMILFSFLFPYLSKIFNKFTPLPDGELKTKLIELGNKCGYRFSNIYVIDASKRSIRENAYFAGFGKTRRIVIYDTLLNKYSVDEIVAIFAHELGHAMHKDTLKNIPNLVISCFVLVIGYYFLTQYPFIYTDFGFSGISYSFGLILFNESLNLLEIIFRIYTNWISRKHEYAADLNATKFGYGKSLISSLKKLSRNNFSYLNVNPLLKVLVWTHPTLTERIENINKNLNKETK